MSTRMVMNGRLVYTNEFAPRPVPALIDRDKVMAVVPEPAERVREVGKPFYDEDDDLNYRVVEWLDPRAGWLLGEQVMKRYNIGFGTVLKLARMGIIDPAMERGSPTKRYRVRDDSSTRKVVAQLKAEIATLKKPAKPRRVNRP